MWIYAQKTGNLFQKVGDVLTFLTAGYSGRGQYQNDPDAQCVIDFGPLPRGFYAFAAPTTFNFMLDCLRLSPDPRNDMCNPPRSGFWIHDGIFSGPHGNSSHGCICVQRPARLQMWASHDHQLQVVGTRSRVENIHHDRNNSSDAATPMESAVTRTQMFLLGCLGGALPVLCNLITVDLAPIVDKLNGLTLGNYVGFSTRVLALILLGGIVAALNTGVTNALSLVQLGIAAPALVASYINGAAPAGNAHTSKASASIISTAHASEQSANTAFQLAGDFWSDFGAGFGPRLDRLDQLNRCGQMYGNTSALPSDPSIDCPPSLLKPAPN